MILRDTKQKCYGIHINSKQDPARFYGILDKNAMESISRAKKILEDRARSYKILQDPTRFYGILDKNAMESISIAKKILQDPIRFYKILDKNAMGPIPLANKILQDPVRSYKILRHTRQKCYGIHIKSKQDP